MANESAITVRINPDIQKEIYVFIKSLSCHSSISYLDSNVDYYFEVKFSTNLSDGERSACRQQVLDKVLELGGKPTDVSNIYTLENRENRSYKFKLLSPPLLLAIGIFCVFFAVAYGFLHIDPPRKIGYDEIIVPGIATVASVFCFELYSRLR